MELRVLTENTAVTYDYRTRGTYETYHANHSSNLPSLIHARLAGTFGDKLWRFLDLGGGTGCVSDFLLARFPRASGVVLDASHRAIDANIVHPRKVCICDSADHLSRYLHDSPFDLILMHDFLHHLVTGRYKSSGRVLAGVLRQAKTLLAPGGHISVLEQCYDGWVDNLPGRMIFAATSNRVVAPVARYLGAGTAGVGVRFQSITGWGHTFARCGLAIEDMTVTEVFRRRRLLHTLLGLRRGRTVHFWCCGDSES